MPQTWAWTGCPAISRFPDETATSCFVRSLRRGRGAAPGLHKQTAEVSTMLWSCLLRFETPPKTNGPFWIASSRNRKGDRMVVAVRGVLAAMC